MRIAQVCAVAALMGLSGAAFAQTQTTTPGQLNQSGVLPGTNNPNNGGPGSNLSGAVSGNGNYNHTMHEGRASAPETHGMRYHTTRSHRTMDRHNGP